MKLEFHGATITSDAGLLAYRELDEALGLTELAAKQLFDRRQGRNSQHAITGLLRQAVYGRLAGYEDTNDADRLRVDPAMRHLVGGRAKMRPPASTSEMGHLETVMLTNQENLTALRGLCGEWVDRVTKRAGLEELILDLDSSESPTYGNQEGSAYNGHFGRTCYHPLFCFNQVGDLERTMLREGGVHSARDWKQVLGPVVKRYRTQDIPKFCLADAAFARPDVYRFLEAEAFQYAIRIPVNEVLSGGIAHLLRRPVGRPSHQLKFVYHSFYYQADSWEVRRRVVAKVE